MKLKLDENLGRSAAEELANGGHDVATVPGQSLASATDEALIDVCRAEGRALVTLDLDLANPLRFPPEHYPGIAVLSINAIYKWRGHSFALMGRGNISKGKGAAQITWMSPRLLGPLRAYVQGFTGYGESLIDYNWNQSTIGFGVALNDAL